MTTLKAERVATWLTYPLRPVFLSPYEKRWPNGAGEGFQRAHVLPDRAIIGSDRR